MTFFDLVTAPARAVRTATIAAIALGSVTVAAPAQTTFTISVDTGPNHIRNITLRAFMERLEETTGGALQAELFESGQLYSARDEPRAVARGDIQMSVTTTPALSAFASDLSVLDLPLFSGRAPAQVNALVDGQLGDALAARISETLDVIVPGRWFLLGFTNTFGGRVDLSGFSDFEGIRIRIPGGAGYIARYAALGAEAVAIPWADVPLALSQNTIDALLTTHETVRSSKMHEAGVGSALVDQVSVIYYVPLVNRAFFEGLSPEHQTAFREAWDSVIDGQREEALSRQAAAAEENAANGIVIHQPDPAELAEVNARLVALAPEIAAQLGVSAEVLDLAISELGALD